MMCRTHFGPSLLVCNARVNKELVVHFIYSTLYNVLLKKVWKEHFQIAYPISMNKSLSEKKVRKLSLGRYIFKRYTFVPNGCILVPSWYTFVPKGCILVPSWYIFVQLWYNPLGTKVYLFEKVPPQWQLFSDSVVTQSQPSDFIQNGIFNKSNSSYQNLVLLPVLL